ncbi:MAG: hypothetical protein AAFX90_10130 [Pseudomonadota bacterium]
MTEVAYVKHPVTKEQKAALRAEGLKIIDARFAPEGAEIIELNPENGLPVPGSPEDVDALERDDVVELLKAHGVESPKGKVDELKAALKQVMFVGE